jgi:uncharacterized membrane protein
MKQSKLFQIIFPFIMLAIPWVYLGIIWKDLPPSIPTHFGISGAPDQFGPRNDIFIAPVIVTLVGLLMYFIMMNIHKIDPKRKYTATNSSVMAKIAVMFIVLLCGITMLVFYWTLKGKVEGIPVLFCGMGLLFAYIGNLMHSIKPNYFVGFRLPWTLENEDNWRKTHQLASKIWFAGGLMLAVTSLIVNMTPMFFIFTGSVFVMALVPAVYSYNIYRRSVKTNPTNQ